MLMCAEEASLANMDAIKTMIRERAPLIASMFTEEEDANDGMRASFPVES
jgi:hypothetical protein